MEYPKISIVTPCFNMVSYIEETILSVLTQQYPNLEYIIIDGGSTDGTTEIIKKYESQLYYWSSEWDNGMYHALQKGFDVSTGEIMGWINADDLLHHKSLFALARCFKEQSINWIQGLNTSVDESGVVVATFRPRNVLNYHFLCFKYLKNETTFVRFGTIQQESTYWRRSLWNKINGLDLSYKYAGDFKLWMSFFKHEKLYLVDTLIGAFRVRRGQTSNIFVKQYIEETKRAVEESIATMSRDERAKIKRLRFYESLKNPILKKILSWLDKDYRLLRAGGNYINL